MDVPDHSNVLGMAGRYSANQKHMITFPFTKLSITSFPLRAVFLAAMLLCVAIGSIYFLLDITAERENLRNQQVSHHLASTAVKQLENEAATLAKECL